MLIILLDSANTPKIIIRNLILSIYLFDDLMLFIMGLNNLPYLVWSRYTALKYNTRYNRFHSYFHYHLPEKHTYSSNPTRSGIRKRLSRYKAGRMHQNNTKVITYHTALSFIYYYMAEFITFYRRVDKVGICARLFGFSVQLSTCSNLKQLARMVLFLQICWIQI